MDGKQKFNFIGGKLKLKGQKVDKSFIQMKKIISKDIKTTNSSITKDEEIYMKNLEKQIESTAEPQEFGYITKDGDNRTEAEKRFDESRLRKLPDKIRKDLSTSYKKKYDSFNKNLSKLPEHFDIPKVGPG